MTDAPKRHPFLDDLAEEVTLISSVLRQPVMGRDLVRKVVKAGGSQYADQTPRFLGSVGGRTFFEYDVTLSGGEAARGLVAIGRNNDGEVIDLNITFSPLGAVLTIAEGIRRILIEDLSGASLI